MAIAFRTQVDNNVNFSIPPDSLCPCGSEKQIDNCCSTIRGLFKQPSKTTPSGPKTNKSLDRCYASILNDCSNSISREHFISKSLLSHLNMNNSLEVEGFPWQKSGKTTLPPNALAARILCQRHNSALSNLDSLAVRLFKSLDEGGIAENAKNLLYLFSGHDLERWLLKVLCGMAFSNNLPIDLRIDLSIPQEWIEILFGYRDFPENMGLFMCNEVGHPFKGPHGIAMRTIANKDRLTGLGLFICGYEFILSMSGMLNRKYDGRGFVYRPFELYTIGGDSKKVLFLVGVEAQTEVL